MTQTAATARRPRNEFLDLVRTVAIIRVLAWHTYGYAWLSYFVASMPAMFFVAGSLMAHSLSRAPSRRVLVARFRRLLIPLWAFALFALTVMLIHDATRTELGDPLHWSQVPWWVFPIWDPQGSDWGVTFWAVLWYMRCLTWLLLLSPVLYWLFNRLSIAIIGLPLGLLIAFELMDRAGNPVAWQFEDAALFGIFWLLGFAYNAGLLSRLGTASRAGATLVFAGAAAAWMLTQDVPNGVVNASYPAHLFVGLTWLFGALTFERALAAFAAWRRPAWVIAWVNDRIFTIYLWHAAGLWVMYELLWIEDRPDWLRHAASLPIVLFVTFACMLAFGWIEDLAARRELHLAPRAGNEPHGPVARRWAAVVIPVAGILGVAAASSAMLTEYSHRADPLPAQSVAIPPSGVGIGLRAKSAVVGDAPPPPRTVPAGISLPPVKGSDLQRIIDSWLRENAIPGATVAIERFDGARWAGATGIDVNTGEPIPVDYVYPTASVTKTFTSALILQLVEEGKVDLDARASEYVRGIAHAQDYTVRDLIQHTSGLMATDAVAPADALLAATRTPLEFEPGTGFLYSSPGYYMLGLIIEKVTGVPYTQALHERLLDPLGLVNSHMDEELAPLDESTHPVSNPALRSSSGVLRSSSAALTAGIGFEYFGILWSSAGLYSTVADIAHWGLALWDSNDVVSAETRQAMSTFLGVEFQYAGLATYPFCPCWRDAGALKAERWGHYGRFGVLEYDPLDRVALAIYTSGTDIDERLIVAYDDLSTRLRDALHGRDFDPEN